MTKTTNQLCVGKSYLGGQARNIWGGGSYHSTSDIIVINYSDFGVTVIAWKVGKWNVIAF